MFRILFDRYMCLTWILAVFIYLCYSFFYYLLLFMFQFLLAIYMLFICHILIVSYLLSDNTLRGNSMWIKKETVWVKGESFKSYYLIRTFSVFDKGGEDD